MGGAEPMRRCVHAVRAGGASWLALVLIAGLLGQQPPPLAKDRPAPASANVGAQAEQDEATRKELISERTKFAKLFVEPDGSRTAEISPEQIHFNGGDGQMKEIDSTLVACEQGCAYRNRRGPVSVRFASSAAAAQIVSVTINGIGAGFGMEDANPASQPTVDQDTITYHEIQPGVDLRFSVGARHLKGYIVLQAPPVQPPEFRFPLFLRNVKPEMGADGKVTLKQADGTTGFTIPRFFMTDSSRDDRSDEPALSEDVALGLERGGSGPVVTVTPDAEWLLDPAREYPVEVDPQLVQEPSPDTFIQSNILNTSQATETELKAGTYDGGSTKARSLLKFNIGSIPDSAIIDTAKLSLHNFYSWSCDDGWNATQVYRIRQDWTYDVTWPNRPNFGAEPVSVRNEAHGYSSSCPAQRIEWGVKTAVEYWRNNPGTNFGLGVRAENETSNYGWRKFRSKNAAGNHPRLIVNYNTPPKVPADRRPANGATVSATPTLSALYDDPDAGDGGFVDFRVFNPDGTRLYPDGDKRGDFAEPGQRSSWTFPSGVLAHGQTYTWKARSFDHNHYSDFNSTLFSFTVDSQVDSPTITSAPEDPTNDTTPSWQFTGESGATFECKLSEGTRIVSDWSVCLSGHSYDLATEPDGTYTFRVRQKDIAGNVSDPAIDDFRLDTTAPDAPAFTSVPSSPSTNANPSWGFTGENGGSFSCDLSSGGTVLFTDATCTSPKSFDLSGQPAGTYTFKVTQTDAAGNTSTAASHDYLYDPDDPAAPRVTSSTHPDPSSWYREDDPKFSWEVNPLPKSGVECYWWTLNRDPSSVSPDTCKGTQTTESYANVGEGTHYFHVSAKNGAGRWSQTRHFRVQIDLTDPDKPGAVVSPSHVPGVAFQDQTIEVNWVKPDDTPSGIAGYSYSFEPEVVCDESVAGPGCQQGPEADKTIDAKTNGPDNTSVESATLDKGTYWFHVKAVDKAGNASKDVVYGPLIVDPQNGAPIPLAPSLDDLLVAQSDENGREQFYPYDAHDLGVARGFVQLHNGNLVAQQTLARIPRQGLNAVIRLTYNSQRSDPAYHDTGVGRGWVLSLSDVDSELDFAQSVTDIDLNSPVLPTLADVVDAVAGATGGLLELTDGDGTVHRFIRKGDPGTKWTSPPGVNLQVEEKLDATGTDVTEYHLVRPDGVKYIARQPTLGDGTTALTWHVVEIVDRNGNSLAIGYDKIGTSLLNIRAQEITHARYGGSPEVVARLDYDTSGVLNEVVSLPGKEAPDPSETDQTMRSYERSVKLEIAPIDADHPDVRVLKSVTENAHALPQYGVAAQRTTRYDYTYFTDPDPVGGGYPLLTSTTDARNQTTSLVYDDGSATGARRVIEVHDRRKNAGTTAGIKPWRYRYGPADANTGERTTFAITPLDAETDYLISGRGRISDNDERVAGANILKITSPPNNQGRIVESFAWSENRLVETTDATGATTRQRYDDLGLLIEVTQPPPNNPSRADLPADAPRDRIRTQLTYRYNDAGWSGCSDPGGPVAGDHCASVADMVRTTSGDVVTGTDTVDTSQRRRTDFGVDGDGNVTKITQCQRTTVSGCDPDQSRITTLDYYDTGGVAAIDGPRRLPIKDVTNFGDTADTVDGGYHPSGMPRKITDAKGNVKSFRFTPYGKLAWTNDRAGRVTRTKLDELNRPVWASAPDGAKTNFEYDRNGNRKATISPRGVRTEWSRDPNEWQTTTTTPGATSTDATSSSEVVYNADGTIRKEINERGVVVATYDYYANQQVKSVTTPASTGQSATTTYFYDSVGREQQVVFPQSNAIDPNPKRETSYTPQGLPAVVSETAAPDANGSARSRTVRYAYNAHSEQIELEGPRAKNGVKARQEWDYNTFGDMTRLRRLVEDGRFIEWRYVYDRAGNQVEVHQPYKLEQDLVSRFRYNELNRLVEQTQDPFNPGHTISYTYLPEGQQKTRVDYHDHDDDPATAPRRLRSAQWTYNVDYTERSMVRTDETGTSGDLARCNYAANAEDKSSGYNADDQLKITRTLIGSSGCDSANTIRTESFSYDGRGWMSELTQKVSATGAAADEVVRIQKLDYRRDGALKSSTWDGRTTTYKHSDAGWLEEATDWRSGASPSSFDYFPSGSSKAVTLGGGVGSASLGYHPDSSLAKLVWKDHAGTAIRSHTDIDYDVGGLRTGEDVTIEPAGTSATADSGGRASFDYDLAGRLTQWTSPFRLVEADSSTDSPQTTYTLDDAGNITQETTTVPSEEPDGREAKSATYNYSNGRLDTRTVTTTDLALAGETTVTNQEFFYTPLGQENRRTSKTTVDTTTLDNQVTRSTYDPGGYTDTVEADQLVDGGPKVDPDIDYLYDASGQLIAKIKTTATGTNTKLFFYWRSGTQLAEETNGKGETKVRYLRGSSGEPLAQQKLETNALGRTDTTWTWLLTDPEGNVATHLKENADGTSKVTAQRAYDPYGSPDEGGNTKEEGAPDSTLGYQSSHTDEDTGNLLLGPRIYDPNVDRFTTADYLVGSTADLAMGTDPLTGNRYLFAAANPVAFYENGYEPCPDPKRCNYYYSGSKEQQQGRNWNRLERYRTASRFIYNKMRKNAGRDWVTQPGVAGTLRFAEMVRANGPWDYKRPNALPAMLGLTPGDYHFPVPGLGSPNELYYDVWSNIHYGYVGRARGFSRDVLQGIPNIAERSTGVNDPPDRISIDLGMNLWDSYGSGLTQSQFRSEFRSTVYGWFLSWQEDHNLEILQIQGNGF